MKKRTIEYISIIIFYLSLFLLPIFGMGLLFGLAGYTSTYFVLIVIGYISLVFLSFASIFKYKFFPLIIISIALIAIGIFFNDNFWEDHNDQLCEDLRAEPSCNEDVCGFDCSNFNGAGFITSGSICQDKDMTLCQEERDSVKQKAADTEFALLAFADIVDTIVASSSPQNEDFEDQRVAIYNCLQIKYGSSADTELAAVRILKEKNLTEEELNKYYEYLASKGQRVNTKIIVAALPGGDKNLSCGDIQQEKVANTSYSTLKGYTDSIDYSCTNDTDCVIKNVGNCCGHYPECVNKNTNTDPEFVNRACSEEAIGGICGFPSINNCQCIKNKCEGLLEE